MAPVVVPRTVHVRHLEASKAELDVLLTRRAVCGLIDSVARGGIRMPNIEVDQDIYDFLLRHIAAFGETPSQVLRRELGLTKQDVGEPAKAPEPHELSDFLASPQFPRTWSVTDRYLAILAELHRQHQDSFDTVLSIRGRQRVYFAKSKDEVRSSGLSVEPRPIPGSPYWAMTNASTSNKIGIMHNVLARLDVSDAAVSAVIAALSP